MNKLRNNVQLIGHIGQDPEIKTLEDGSKMARLSLATNEKFTNKKGEKVEKTHWHSIVFWNKSADFLETYVKKGMQLAISGALTTRSWEDESGAKQYRTEVVGREVMIL